MQTWLIFACAKLPGLFTQASHWMGPKLDRADFPCLALDVSNGCSCISDLPHILKGPPQLQSIPPQIICDSTPQNLGGPRGLISSADKDTGFGTKLLCVYIQVSVRVELYGSDSRHSIVKQSRIPPYDPTAEYQLHLQFISHHDWCFSVSLSPPQ